MEILPVLDLLNGIVVRGIAGRRDGYRPLTSIVTDSHEPRVVARDMQRIFGFCRFYVADLDGIVHHRANWNVFQQLIEDGFQLLIDAGIDTADVALRIQQAGARPIVGLESCRGPEALGRIVTATNGQMTFSLDLKDGQPMMCGDADWTGTPFDIARTAVGRGVQEMIVLDLADVGMSTGGGTDHLCRSLRDEFPGLRLICGGGVRGLSDVRRLGAFGASSVLVASALHDGRLSFSDIQEVAEGMSYK